MSAAGCYPSPGIEVEDEPGIQVRQADAGRRGDRRGQPLRKKPLWRRLPASRSSAEDASPATRNAEARDGGAAPTDVAESLAAAIKVDPVRAYPLRAHSEPSLSSSSSASLFPLSAESYSRNSSQTLSSPAPARAPSLQSKTRSNNRARKARALLNQLQEEEEERLAEVHGLGATVQAHSDSQDSEQPSQQSQYELPLPEPQSQNSLDGYGSQLPLRRAPTVSQTNSGTPYPEPEAALTRRRTVPAIMPRCLVRDALELEHLPPELDNSNLRHRPKSYVTAAPSELDNGDARHRPCSYEATSAFIELHSSPISPYSWRSLHPDEDATSSCSSIATASISMTGELDTAISRQELNAAPTTRRNSPSHRTPSYNYVDGEDVSRYNTLPGEPFPLNTNATTSDQAELADQNV